MNLIILFEYILFFELLYDLLTPSRPSMIMVDSSFGYFAIIGLLATAPSFPSE